MPNCAREARVIEELLGNYQGTVVSDFYAGYNNIGGSRQRCWVHYARDLHELKQDNAQNSAVVAWADSILAQYRDAKKYQAACRKAISNGTELFGYGVFDRRRARKRYENALLELARQKVVESTDRQRVLAQRIENFLPEFFTFVEYPAVPSDNNAAERAIRPAVINRKVCGGTRSARGSLTMAILMSLLHTWRLRGISPIEQCIQVLGAHIGPGSARAPAG